MKRKTEFDTARRIGRPPVDRRLEILDAAELLYDDIGFEKTTMADIAKALSMSPANLYRNFPNRRAIDDAIAERRLIVIEDLAWVEARKAGDDPEAAFLALVSNVSKATADILFREGRISDICLAATRGHWPVVSRFLQGLHGALRHVLAEGQRLGRFDRALDLDATAGTLASTLLRVWHPVVMDLYGAEGLEVQADKFGRLLVRSLF